MANQLKTYLALGSGYVLGSGELEGAIPQQLHRASVRAISNMSSGTAIFKDGGAAGTEIWGLPANTSIAFGPDGLKFNKNVYVTMAGAGTVYIATEH